MLTWTLENTVIAGLLALVAFGICAKFRNRPALCHLIWTIVLVRLVVPTISIEMWPPKQFRETIESKFSTVLTTAQHTIDPRALGRQEPDSDHSLRQGSSASIQSEPDGLASSRPAFLAPPSHNQDPVRNDAVASDSLKQPSHAQLSGPDHSQQSNLLPRQTSFPMLRRAEKPSESPSSKSQQWSTGDSISETKANKKALSDASSSNTNNADQYDKDRSSDLSESKPYEDEELDALAAQASLDLPRTQVISSSNALWNWDRATILRFTSIACMGLWLAGTLFFLMRHFVRIVRFQRAIWVCPNAGAELNQTVANVADAMGITTPQVRMMPGLTSPVIWHLGRTRYLLWPTNLPCEDTANSRQCKGIVAHEIAHLCRRDHILAWFEIFVTSALWWNPLAWFAISRIRHYADLACDARVVSVFPAERHAYAKSLIDVAETMSTQPNRHGGFPGRTPTPALALGLGETARDSFERRIIMIAREKTSCRVSPMVAAFAVAFGSLLLPTWAGEEVNDTYISWSGEELKIDAGLLSQIELQLNLRKAKMYDEADRSQLAIEHYNLVASQSSDHPEVFGRLGYLYAAQEDFDSSIKAFANHAKHSKDKGRSTPLYNLACVQSLDGQHDDAIKSLTKAIHYGWTDYSHARDDADFKNIRDDDRFDKLCNEMARVSDLVAEADNATKEEHYIDAASAYGKLADSYSNNGYYQMKLAYALIMAGELDAGEAALRQQIAMDHAVPTALYNMACIRSLENDVENGLKYLGKSIKIGWLDFEQMDNDPDLENLRGTTAYEGYRKQLMDRSKNRELADLAMKYEDWGEAIRMYEHLEASAPEQSKDWKWESTPSKKATAYFYLGDYDSAGSMFKDSILAGNNVADNLYNLACCSARQGNTDAAGDYLRFAIDLGYTDVDHIKSDPDLGSLQAASEFTNIVNYASDRMTLNTFGAADWQDLRDQAHLAIEKDEKDGNAYLRLGFALLRQAEYEDARQAFLKQGELGYGTGIAWYNVACCYALAGDPESSVQWLEKAVVAGAVSVEHMSNDPDLESLQGTDAFNALLQQLDEVTIERKQKTKAYKESRADAKEVVEVSSKGYSKNSKNSKSSKTQKSSDDGN